MSRVRSAARSPLPLTLGLSLAALAASCSLLTPTGDLTGGEPATPILDASIDMSSLDQASDHTIDQSIPATCENKRLDGDETDIDCGGSCTRCGDHMDCKIAADCASDDCVAKTCQPATCLDKIQNGAETGVDCGGGTCPACADGKPCVTQSDCINLLCKKGLCAAATCDDGLKDGAETDIDCGGLACPKCGNEKSCQLGSDCLGLVCAPDPNMSVPKCQPCADATEDGTETDVDCGGLCKPCPVGRHCVGQSDCASGECDTGVCKVACGSACKIASDCAASCPCDVTTKVCGPLADSSSWSLNGASGVLGPAPTPDG